MLRVIQARLHQGHRTMRFPDGPPPALPEHFRGRPTIDNAKCRDGCHACRDACPTQAITINGAPAIDLGRCLFARRHAESSDDPSNSARSPRGAATAANSTPMC